MKNEQEIQNLYRDGTRVKHIAEAYEISKEAVYQRLRKMEDFEEVANKLREKRKKKRLSSYEERLPEIIRLREDGIGSLEVSEKLDIPYKVVTKLLQGTEYDNTMKAKEARNQKIYEACQGDKTQSEVAEEFDTTQSNVANILHRHFGK